jgi:hypothetical protein
MEDIVKELKKIVPFKETTTVGNLVLIAIENPKSVVYGIVTEISRDDSKRQEWWHLSMHILSVPPQKVTWTLRETQFTGKEIFTMGDEGRFIQAVELEEAGHLEEQINLKKKKKKPSKKAHKSPLRVVK